MAIEIVYIGYRGIRGTAEIRGQTINAKSAMCTLFHIKQ